jgi:hypothetical protein
MADSVVAAPGEVREWRAAAYRAAAEADRLREELVRLRAAAAADRAVLTAACEVQARRVGWHLVADGCCPEREEAGRERKAG